jgi:hypothetical protein
MHIYLQKPWTGGGSSVYIYIVHRDWWSSETVARALASQIHNTWGKLQGKQISNQFMKKSN